MIYVLKNRYNQVKDQKDRIFLARDTEVYNVSDQLSRAMELRKAGLKPTPKSRSMEGELFVERPYVPKLYFVISLEHVQTCYQSESRMDRHVFLMKRGNRVVNTTIDPKYLKHQVGGKPQ